MNLAGRLPVSGENGGMVRVTLQGKNRIGPATATPLGRLAAVFADGDTHLTCIEIGSSLLAFILLGQGACCHDDGIQGQILSDGDR
jgi:hypothetical protein